MKASNKLDNLISKSLNDVVIKQVSLSKAACSIANKSMAAMMKIDKTLQSKMRLTEDSERNISLQILKVSKEKIIASVTQAVWHYAKVLELHNQFKEMDVLDIEQKLSDKIIREVKYTVISQQIAIDSFNSYIYAAHSI